MESSNEKIKAKIMALKKARKAVILAHNYQLGEIQDVADFVGDSLDLSQRASMTDASVIVFCGVHFMAETAAILSSQKIVLLPDIGAGCPMANMITVESLLKIRAEHPSATVVCYVNTSAAVKAESDICCTSANAVRIVSEYIDNQEVIFVPDQYLGHFVQSKLSKKLILWPGYCPTHAKIQAGDIVELKNKYPGAKVVVHPECRPEVIELADEALSTSGIIRFAQTTNAKDIIVGTEIGILHRLKKENPDKRFIAASDKAICPNMKKITLEKVLWSLEDMTAEIKIPENVRLRARVAVDKMLDIGRND